MSETLSAFIRREIQRRGLSERELSRRAGLSSSAVHHIINHPESQPTVETCLSLAQALDLPGKVLLQLAGYGELDLAESFDEDVVALASYLNDLPAEARRYALDACWAIVRLAARLSEKGEVTNSGA